MTNYNYNYNVAAKSEIKVLDEDLVSPYNDYLKMYAPEHFLPMIVGSNYSFQSAGLGVWSFDFKTKILRLCKHCKKLIGLPDLSQVSIEQLSNFLTEDQEAGLLEAIVNAGELGLPLCYQFPNTLQPGRNNQQQWLRITGIIGDDEECGRKKLFGTLCDITIPINQELRLKDAVEVINHELRSPLSSIKLYIQLCQSFATGNEDKRVSKFLACANEMVDKAVTMLDYFEKGPSFQNGRIKLHPAEFNMNKLLSEVVDNFRITHPDFLFILRQGPQVTINGDRDRIGQVIQNLIANAVKYSPEPDTIVIKYMLQGEYLHVSVQDHGIGIDRQEHDKIFEKYYRVENTTGTAVKGHGIGLYLCKTIIEGHRGKICFKSAKNKGSNFFFQLPLSGHPDCIIN